MLQRFESLKNLKKEKKLQKIRDTKSQNFPVGRISRAKTFRTECVNRFRDKNAPKVRQKCVNSFCDINVQKVHKLVLHTCHFHDGTHGGKLFRPPGKFLNNLETFQTNISLFAVLMQHPYLALL